MIEANRPASDNTWESVKSGSDLAIKRWIAQQMQGRACTVVLVGQETANRMWINHEIIESWNKGMGVVGIQIHGLKNTSGFISNPGANPFDYIYLNNGTRKMSSVVRCYDPPGAISKDRYAWIKTYLAGAIEEAIKIRKSY